MQLLRRKTVYVARTGVVALCRFTCVCFFLLQIITPVEKGWKHSGTERSNGLMLYACCIQVVVLYLHQYKLAIVRH